ncbi:hypothetical protein ACLOJK_034848 [Asimina triloba]
MVRLSTLVITDGEDRDLVVAVTIAAGQRCLTADLLDDSDQRSGASSVVGFGGNDV